jgi:hypothetical protein
MIAPLRKIKLPGVVLFTFLFILLTTKSVVHENSIKKGGMKLQWK